MRRRRAPRGAGGPNTPSPPRPCAREQAQPRANLSRPPVLPSVTPLDPRPATPGASGARRTLAWFPTDGSADPGDVNVSVTITNTSLEFTKLGSFGTA